MVCFLFSLLTFFCLTDALEFNKYHNQQQRFLQAGLSHKLSSLSSSSKFNFPNPFLKITTSSDTRILKQDSNTPPDDTDCGGDVYVGTPKSRFLEKKLTNDVVLIPCSQCMKLVDRYIRDCAFNEASSNPLVTIRQLCENSLQDDPSFTDRDMEYCHSLGQKLAVVTGTDYDALQTSNHAIGSCAMYERVSPASLKIIDQQYIKLQMCDANGGPPDCYSGFCDEIAECTDCPSVPLRLTEQAALQAEVCGARGVCRLASLKNRVGYCQCDEGYSGTACDKRILVPPKNFSSK